MAVNTWAYYTCYVYFKITKKGGVLGFDEGEWTLKQDKEYKLSEGLNDLGKKGWELVAIQETLEHYGGASTTGGAYNKTFIYIFKGPS